MRRDVPILLLEDDKLDVKNIKRAFEANHIANPLYVVSNGEDALAFLRHEAPFTDPNSSPKPGLILSDLNMPRMNGIEFLRSYKQDESLQAIPTVVLTTSEEQRDRIESYKIGVAGYIVKPVDFTTFLDAIRRFHMYWSLCALPD